VTPNSGNAITYGYAGKVSAIFKNFTINVGNTVTYGYFGKAGATIKSITPNAGNAVGYDNTCKAGANTKSKTSNAGKGTAGKVKGRRICFYFLLTVFNAFKERSHST